MNYFISCFNLTSPCRILHANVSDLSIGNRNENLWLFTHFLDSSSSFLFTSDTRNPSFFGFGSATFIKDFLKI